MYEYLVRSYTKHIYGLLIWGREGVRWARDLVSVLKVGWCGCMEGPRCYQAMSKLIIDKSTVGIILCLSVLRNYTKVYYIQCTIMCSICSFMTFQDADVKCN